MGHVRIEYFEDEGQELLELYIAKGDEEPRLVEASELFYELPKSATSQTND